MKRWGVAIVCLLVGCGGRIEGGDEERAAATSEDARAVVALDASWPDVIHLEPPPPWDGGAPDVVDAQSDCSCIGPTCSAPPGCR